MIIYKEKWVCLCVSVYVSMRVYTKYVCVLSPDGGKCVWSCFLTLFIIKITFFLRLVIVYNIIAPFCLWYSVIFCGYVNLICLFIIISKEAHFQISIILKTNLLSVHWSNFVASTNYEKKFLKNDMHWLHRASSLLKLALVCDCIFSNILHLLLYYSGSWRTWETSLMPIAFFLYSKLLTCIVLTWVKHCNNNKISCVWIFPKNSIAYMFCNFPFSCTFVEN